MTSGELEPTLSEPGPSRSGSWPAFERFLVARRLAAGAIAAEAARALAGAAAAEASALEGAASRHSAALETARGVVEQASHLTGRSATLRAALASLRRLTAAHPGLACWVDVDPDAAPAGGPFGFIRLGRLARPIPTIWTAPYVSEADAAAIPALTALRDRHLLFEGGPPGATEDLLRSVLLRIIVGSPGGEVRVTLLDPRGSGQGLAGFLELPPALRGEKVWVSSDEIEAQLRNLNATVESVLQTRLGARFSSLADYNAANPAVAEPFRVVAILGLPGGGWTERGLDLLARLSRNGPRAGVYLLATLDRAAPTPRNVVLDEVVVPGTSIKIGADERAVIADPAFGDMPFIPDNPPGALEVERWLARVAAAFAGRSRALAAAAVLPPVDWGASSADGLDVTIGVDSEGDPLSLHLGDDPAHGLVGGMVGMGKSNLLHVIVAGLTSRYGPDELELDLLDFKEGVGFAPYRTLPHARSVALETEREFALSVLKSLQSEMVRRGRLFGAAGVDQFPAFRVSGARLPRRILLIDEFQVLLAGDDAIAREASAALEDLVKRGRGFGIHVLLCSQSPSVAGPYLSRIYNQMGLRVALRCRPADALAILGEGNDAAAKLEEQGEAIVNAELGQPAGNRRVRVAFLGRDELTARLAAILDRDAGAHPGPVTFEGATPAELVANPRLRALRSGGWAPERGTVEAFLGEPVEVKGPTSARLERYPRANLLVAGADEEAAYGLLIATVVSIAAEDADACFDVVDLARPSSPMASALAPIAERLGNRLALAGPRDAGAVLEALDLELRSRAAPGAEQSPSRYLVITGLHRWRELRGPNQFDSSPEGGTLLRLLDEGPDVGLHVIAWTDGQASLDRSLKRGAAANFDLRAVLRVPETDSQNLLESTAAARLANNRALFRNEEWPAGQLEKFKPYAVPSPEALDALLG